MPNVERPLSPHLTIYRPQLTTVLSITHRLTGLALVAGSALIAAWLWIAAYAPSSYPEFHDMLMSTLGQCALVGWTVAFYFHLGNGVRHLFWDIGKGFTLPQAYRSGWTVVLFTLVMTAMTWGFIRTVGL